MENKNIYKIVRYFQDGRKPITKKRNLTLEEAQGGCNDDETSSRTASKYGSMTKRSNLDKKQKHWFEGYTTQ